MRRESATLAPALPAQRTAGLGAAGASAGMFAERNKAAALRVPLEIYNQGDLTVADEVMAGDCVEHATVAPGLPPGLAGFKLFVTGLRSAFPDLSYTVEDVLAEGDRVAIRLTARGTQVGEFLGHPATAGGSPGPRFTSVTWPTAG